jgi:pimeloyl-ACP methyl ester carboxylesterase
VGVRGLASCLLLASLLAGPVRGDVGLGASGLFTVDTRYGFSLGSGVSGFFSVDTRHSGWSGDGFSALFTVDTRGATSGTAVIAGRVTDLGGTGLSGASVSALVGSVVKAEAATDSGGYFTLASLPAGTYDLSVGKSGYLSGVRYGLAVTDGQAVSQNFALAAIPAPPVVVPTNRTPDPPATLATSQLKRFDGKTWVTVTSTSDIDRAKPTVVITHGWNSSSDYWPSNTAASLLAGGVSSANLLAWDWRTNAGTEISLSGLRRAFDPTPREGRLLAQALTNVLGLSYQQGVHFIGHSLGTLVNAAAANYLHSQTGGAFDWHRTQMTLLDNAEAANVTGCLLLVGYIQAGFESLLGLGQAPSLGWVSPLPEQRAWADNYISFFGLYHPSVVNANLFKGLAYARRDNPIDWVLDVHGYPCAWYADTARNPNLSQQLGNRYSFERLGVGAQFPSPWPYPDSTLFEQVAADDYTLVTIQDVPGYIAGEAVEFARSKLLEGLDGIEGIGQKVGDVTVNVVESGVGVLEEATSMVVSQPISSLQAVLRSAGVGQPNLASGLPPGKGQIRPMDEDDYTNSPSAVWLPVQVPTNAALFSFDFTFTGDAGQDLLSASLSGTNVFTLEAQDMPVGQVLNSGPIDVSAFAGKTVELFFGLLGGSSTNATLSIAAMRFYQIDPPLLTADKAGANIILSWSATTFGYSLEASGSLTSPSWSAVTNVPTLSGMRQCVTNSLSGQSQFYRLRRN